MAQVPCLGGSRAGVNGYPYQTSLADPDHPHLKSLEVPDPYLGGEDGFEQVYRLVSAASRGLLHAVRTPG